MGTRKQQISSLIDMAVGVMTDLAIDPLALEIDGRGARILAAMGDFALRTRSRGPYTPDDPPAEAMEMIQWVALRWSTKLERPEFTIEGGGRWPALVVVLPASQVLVRYVVPEDAPPVYQPEPGSGTLSGNINMALRSLSETLRAAGKRFGKDPPVSLTLSYSDDPDYDKWVGSLDEEFQLAIPPVIATIEVDRSRCSRKQRTAHDEALRAAAYSSSPVEPLGRNGFTTRIGWARLQDSGR